MLSAVVVSRRPGGGAAGAATRQHVHPCLPGRGGSRVAAAAGGGVLQQTTITMGGSGDGGRGRWRSRWGLPVLLVMVGVTLLVTGVALMIMELVGWPLLVMGGVCTGVGLINFCWYLQVYRKRRNVTVHPLCVPRSHRSLPHPHTAAGAATHAPPPPVYSTFCVQPHHGHALSVNQAYSATSSATPTMIINSVSAAYTLQSPGSLPHSLGPCGSPGYTAVHPTDYNYPQMPGGAHPIEPPAYTAPPAAPPSYEDAISGGPTTASSAAASGVYGS